MHKFYQSYCALLDSAEQLESCKAEATLVGLLAHIKQLWNCSELSDDQLLGEIAQLNQIAIDDTDVQLAGRWLPYRYQPKRQQINWLLSVGHATEPFQDEYISRCRQECLLNQIIQPFTSLKVVLQQAENIAAVTPAGFIFHLSRCGSTLISGCLSELDTTCVLSESPLLTELLLDSDLSPIEQKRSLQAFINLQGAAFPKRPQMIIKWNAWDIFRWEFIREIYPQVPVIFLVRNPVEILASHQKMVGRHMSGDLMLARFHPLFAMRKAFPGAQVLVLEGLLQAMINHVSVASIHVIDYRQLSAKSLESIANLFRCKMSGLDYLKIQDRLRFHSKNAGQPFVADSSKKQQMFAAQQQESIRGKLMPSYNRLLKMTINLIEEVIDVH